MKNIGKSGLALSVMVLAGSLVVGATSADAGCMRKAAQATAESAQSAKWFAMETMVQSVGWELWPAFLANGSVPGYSVSNKKSKCVTAAGGIGVTCKSQATFCKK